jgi:hypothetical protein
MVWSLIRVCAVCIIMGPNVNIVNWVRKSSSSKKMLEKSLRYAFSSLDACGNINPCKNNGSCLTNLNGVNGNFFSCYCTIEFYGTLCESSKLGKISK